MTENVFAAAMYRLPIVMMAVNRTLGPPWNIWVDHGDTLDFTVREDGRIDRLSALAGVPPEQDLVVRPLDPRLGKVPNLSAAAVLDEATVLAIHGLCHLLGHDHGERREGRAMHRRERRGLRAARVADIPRPYGLRPRPEP